MPRLSTHLSQDSGSEHDSSYGREFMNLTSHIVTGIVLCQVMNDIGRQDL